MKIIMENAFKLFRRKKTTKKSRRKHRTLGRKILDSVWQKRVAEVWNELVRVVTG